MPNSTQFLFILLRNLAATFEIPAQQHFELRHLGLLRLHFNAQRSWILTFLLTILTPTFAIPSLINFGFHNVRKSSTTKLWTWKFHDSPSVYTWIFLSSIHSSYVSNSMTICPTWKRCYNPEAIGKKSEFSRRKLEQINETKAMYLTFW